MCRIVRNPGIGVEVNDVEKLVGNGFQRESFGEYAEHSLTHDDVTVTAVKDPAPVFDSDAWWVRLATWVHVCKSCQRNQHGSCTGDCDCALNGHPDNPGAS